MLYVDTSAFVSMFVREGRSAGVVDLLAQRSDAIAISDWVMTETHSAIALKVRSGKISEKEAKAARAKVARSIPEYYCEAIIRADFETASSLIDGIGVPLRAADALHLAICKRLGAELLTFDSEMKNAAIAAGILATNLTV